MTLANRTIALTLKAIGTGTTKAALKEVDGSVLNLRASLRELAGGAALGLVANEAKQFGIESFKAAAQAERFALSNNRLAKSLGTTTDVLVRGVQQAAAGTIDKLSALEATNKAMLFGIVSTQTEMESLTRIATTLGRATGQTTAKSFDDLVVALSRGSPLILDNLGISLKLSEAYEEYAASLGKTVSQLSNTEKQQAFLNVASQKGLELTDELGGVMGDSLTDVENYNRSISDLKVSVGELLTRMSGGAGTVASFIDGITDRVDSLSGSIDLFGQMVDLIQSGEADIGGGLAAAGQSLLNPGSIPDQIAQINADAAAAKEAELEAARNKLPVEQDTTEEIRQQVDLMNDAAKIRAGTGSMFGFGLPSSDLGRGSGIDVTTVAQDTVARIQNETKIAEETERLQKKAAKEAERAWTQQQNNYRRQIEQNNQRITSLIERQLQPTLQEVWEAPADDRRVDENARRLADVAVKGFSSPWLQGLRQTFGGQDFFNPIIEAINSGDGGALQQAATNLLSSPAITQLWDIELIKERVRNDLQRQNAKQQLINTILQQLQGEGLNVGEDQIKQSFGGVGQALGTGITKVLPEAVAQSKTGAALMGALIKDLREDDSRFIEAGKIMLQGIAKGMMDNIDILSEALIDTLAERLSSKFGFQIAGNRT